MLGPVCSFNAHVRQCTIGVPTPTRRCCITGENNTLILSPRKLITRRISTRGVPNEQSAVRHRQALLRKATMDTQSLSCGAFRSLQSWTDNPTVPETFFETLRRKQCGLQRSVSDSLRLDTNPENGNGNALNVHYRRRGPRYFGPAEDVDTWAFKKNAYHAKHFAILP